MNKYAIYHTPDVPYAYGKDIDTLSLRVRTARGDIKEGCVYYKDRYDDQGEYKEAKLGIYTSTALFDFWSVDISCFRNRYRYLFRLIDKKGERVFLDERGLQEVESIYETTPFQYAYLSEGDLYQEEEWLQQAVVYQIFVDRFCNGKKDSSIDGLSPWGGKVSYTTLFGGDLQGIINKLDYLQDLGINLIYLTPIFKSSTNHKYNTADYYSIDPQFGDLEIAKELVKKCHERGIKIVFDAVFNHSGNDFFAFEDIKQKGEMSKYKDWYHLDSLPINEEEVNYYTFGTKHKKMPKFRIHNPEVTDYLLEVAKYWIQEVDIDGWRLDVCDEVDHEFWRAFRKAVKEVKPEAIIIGEIMHESESFLRGDQLDGIMNYPFKWAITDFFARRTITAYQLDHILAQSRSSYMDSITKQLWNLCDSHDTKRFLTEASEDKIRLRLMLIFQFTYIGVPYIYYGDEIGISGGDDPECRKCMEWEPAKQDIALLNFYKKLISLRRNSPILQQGTYETIYCKESLLGFKRRLGEDEIVVLINNSDDKKKLTLSEPIRGVELLSNKIVAEAKTVSLLPMSAKIIRLKPKF